MKEYLVRASDKHMPINMSKRHKYLAFTIKILEFVNMWSNENSCCKLFKDYYAMAIIIGSMLTIMIDFITQLCDGDEDLEMASLIESLIGTSALGSVMYVSVCFAVKKAEIKLLIKHLRAFEKYIPKVKIEEAEDAAKFYTKSFILYGIFGNGLYDVLPFLSMRDCIEKRTKHMEKFGIPCRKLVNYVLPFRWEETPYYEAVILEQILVAILGTTVVMTITMLVCGILTHIAANLEHLETMINNISYIEDGRLRKHVNLCVKYHTIIIEISDKTNNAFSVMMLVHITWTSFIISVLGFEIIMENNYWISLRFIMHLGGWLGMLFLVCIYGQILVDKSTNISSALYATKWYEKPTKIRESLLLILLRSQKPLVLRAAGVNVMSLATFIGVLYSAYSYFTLLLKMKP